MTTRSITIDGVGTFELNLTNNEFYSRGDTDRYGAQRYAENAQHALDKIDALSLGSLQMSARLIDAGGVKVNNVQYTYNVSAEVRAVNWDDGTRFTCWVSAKRDVFDQQGMTDAARKKLASLVSDRLIAYYQEHREAMKAERRALVLKGFKDTLAGQLEVLKTQAELMQQVK